MSGMTSERLEELRRIAEAATPGPWAWRMSKDGRILDLITLETGYNEEIITPSHINAWLQVKGGLKDFIPAFAPATALALLDEIERLRQEREVLAEALRHVYTCENCECALCPQGTELSYRAYRALGEAMDLLDGEEIVGNVTRFVLYDPDLNWWECQACRFWWEFENGDPYEHDMRFCPRCGRWIMREAQHLRRCEDDS